VEKLSILILSGLTNGSVYGLVALSLALIYSTGRIVNFAQGEFVMIATMCTVLFVSSMALPWPLAIVLIMVVVAAFALFVEQVVYTPLLRAGAAPLTIMMGCFAAAIIATGAALIIWGPNQLFVPSLLPQDPLDAGFIVTNGQQIGIIGTFAVLMVATWLVLHRTGFGLTVRATGVSPAVAQLMGIRVRGVVRYSFVLSGIVSGASGILIGPILGGHFSMGLILTVKGFMAAMLGGMGSPFAAAAGGLMIGLLEALIGGYGNSLFAEPIVFGLILVVLFFRPYGLLGEFEAVRR